MNIYVSGDSFSDGTGLGDHTLKNYPGDIPVPNIHNFPIQTRLDWQEYVYRSGEFEKIRKIGRKLAWPALLSKNLSIEVTNGSYPGSTLTSIYLRMISDFKNTTPTKTFISLPNPNRIPIFMKNENTLEKILLSITPTSHELYSGNQRKLWSAYWKEYSDEEILIFYLKDLISIESYVKLKTGEFPVLIDSIFLDDILETYHASKLEITKELWNNSGLKNHESILSMKKLLTDFHTYTADGHFGADVHKSITDEIIIHHFV